MDVFEVMDIGRDGDLVSLQDGGGQLHVARLLGVAPLRQDLLHGRQAKLGAHLLLAEGRGVPLQVRFEAVACSQDEALERMHPAPLEADPAQALAATA